MAKVCPTCEKEYGDDVLYCSADGCTLQSLTIGDDLVGTVVADRYLITDMVGEGGMGRVYLARHVRLPQNVAVKVLHPWLVRDANVVTRFRREAVNASQIENEHVARVFDHGEIGDGLLYIAMEFVEGKPLGEIVARNGPLSIPRAIEITRQVAEALAAAHERPTPIVHRDLKPDNILLGVRRDGSDRAKVVDFGIAEAMSGGGPKLTQQGLVIGTPEYMSPEQLSAISLDWRSDIYSLALVTFYMLTGRLPFEGESPHEAALMRLRDRPKTLAEVTNDGTWPPALQAVMDKALARSPAERYETAPEFAHALADATGVPDRPLLTPTPARVDVLPPRQAPAAADKPAGGDKRARKVAVASAVVLGIAAIAVVGVLALRGRAGNGAPAPTASAPTAPPTVAARDSAPSTVPAVSPVATPNASGPKPAAPNTVAVAGALPARGDTAISSVKAGPEASSSSGPRASLDYVQSLIVGAREDTSRAKVLARAVLDSARAIVPRLESRPDVVEMGVYTVAAYLLLEQKSDACLMLGSIGAEAAQMAKFAAQVRLWNERLDCKD
jgi:eukaryotic-like serine/threonine-protein kinase